MNDHQSKNKNDKTVITGIGIISSAGCILKNFTNIINSGQTQIKKITSPSYKDLKGAMIPKDLIKPVNGLSKISTWIANCINDALHDGNLNLEDYKRRKIFLILGTFLGEVGNYNSLDQFNPTSFENISKETKRRFNVNLETIVISSACASANIAIGIGRDLIKYKEADVVLVGAYEALGEFVLAGMNSLRILSDSIKPFNKNRNGTILGEGAGILLLESEANALKRKTEIYAEVSGYGLTNDAHHPLRPDLDGTGISNAIKMALINSNINKSDIDYINAHGTGTKYNDSTESKAIIDVFGRLSKKIPVTSIKPIIGHTLGAAGILEVISTINSINSGKIPPTLNYDLTEDEYILNIVKDDSYTKNIKFALSNSFGFGGVNSIMVISKYINKRKITVQNKVQNNVITYKHIDNYEIDLLKNTQEISVKLSHICSKFMESSKINSSDKRTIGIILDIGNKNLKSQLEFCQEIKSKEFQYVSPKLFIYSFPGILVGEICRFCKISGPSITMCNDSDKTDTLFLLAHLMIKEGRAKKVIAGKIVDNILSLFLLEDTEDPFNRSNVNKKQEKKEEIANSL